MYVMFSAAMVVSQGAPKTPHSLKRRRLTKLTTVGTKIIADPEKGFQELTSEKLLIFFRDGSCLELIIVSSNFQTLLALAGQITGIGLREINFSKKVLKITGPALFRINSVIISARTVVSFGAQGSGVPRSIPH